MAGTKPGRVPSMSEQTCPRCGDRVPEPLMTSEWHAGGVSRAVQQEAACPGCGAKLVREPDSPVAERREWHEPRDDSEEP
jgi:endogenous inhibitor of DNA gyrase (YacG/DUF329 family)